MNWEIHCINYVFVLFDFNGEMPEKVSDKGSCSYQTQKKLIGCLSCQLNKFEPAGHRVMMPQHVSEDWQVENMNLLSKSFIYFLCWLIQQVAISF